jgi:hypothetical protein
MSYKKISELESANVVTGNEKVLILQDSQTKSVDSSLIKNYIQSGSLNISPPSFIESTSTNSGALVINGGIGTNGRLNANNIRCNSNTQSNSASTGSLIVNGGVGIGSSLNSSSNALNVNGITKLSGVESTSTSTGALIISGGIGLSGSINTQGGIRINSGQISSSPSTGALTVNGGVGISDSLYLGNDLNVSNSLVTADRFFASRDPLIPDTNIFVKVDGDIYATGTSFSQTVTTSNITLNSNNNSGTINSAADINLIPGSQSAVKISGSEVATKSYVDSVAQGLDIKKSVKVATTARINVRFENDAPISGSATTVIDGVTLINGDRVLVKDQGTGTDNREKNGIWIVGSTWTRASDANSSDKVSPGMFVFIEEGTANADTGWVLTNNGSIVLGTTKLDFTQFSGGGGGSISAGANLNKVGSSLNLNNNISLNGDTASTSTTTGTLVVTGGVGVSGSINARGIGIGGYMDGGTWYGPTSIIANPSMKLGSIGTIGGYGGTGLTNATSASTSTNTGTLVVEGGVGISGCLNIGGYVTNTLIGGYVVGNTSFGVGQPSTSTSSGTLVVTGGVGVSGRVSANNVQATAIGNVTAGTGAFTTLSSSSTTTMTANIPSTSTSSGTLVVTGGVGVSGRVSANNVQATAIGNVTAGTGAFTTLSSSSTTTMTANIPSTSTSTGTLVVTGGIGVSGTITTQNLNVGGITTWRNDSTGALSQFSMAGTFSLIGSSTTSPIFEVIPSEGNIGVVEIGGPRYPQNQDNGTISTSQYNGALVVNGGVGVNGNINVGQDVNAGGTLRSDSIICDNPSGNGNGKFIFKISTFSGFYPYDPSLDAGVENAGNDAFRVINNDGRECLRVSGQGAVFSPYGFFINDSSGNYLPAARIYKTNIGNGLLTTFTITHNLSTRDVMVSVYRDSATPGLGYDTINTSTSQINRINLNQIQLTFPSAPPSDGYRVVIMG